MADINVERKSGMGIWPWIIGLIVLALLIWALSQMFGRDDQAAVTDRPVADTLATDRPVTEEPVASPTGAAAIPPAVEQFGAWVDRREAQDDMGRQHQFTITGLRQLADALESVAQRHETRPAVQQSIQTVRQQADQLEQSDPAVARHANMTREAFTSAADAIATLQREHHAGVADAQVNQVREAAQAIDTGTPLLDQRERVQTFFDRARDAIRALAADHRRA